MAHPGHGGCIIQEICERCIGGENKQYLVLIPKTDPNTRLLAPVENVEKIGLRDLISPETADRLLAYFSSADEGMQWVSDHAKRRQAYEEILRHGALDDIARMIRELTVQETHSKLSNGDKELLPKAQKKLFSEIALAKGIEIDRAISMADQAMAM